MRIRHPLRTTRKIDQVLFWLRSARDGSGMRIHHPLKRPGRYFYHKYQVVVTVNLHRHNARGVGCLIIEHWQCSSWKNQLITISGAGDAGATGFQRWFSFSPSPLLVGLNSGDKGSSAAVPLIKSAVFQTGQLQPAGPFCCPTCSSCSVSPNQPHLCHHLFGSPHTWLPRA